MGARILRLRLGRKPSFQVMETSTYHHFLSQHSAGDPVNECMLAIKKCILSESFTKCSPTYPTFFRPFEPQSITINTRKGDTSSNVTQVPQTICYQLQSTCCLLTATTAHRSKPEDELLKGSLQIGGFLITHASSSQKLTLETTSQLMMFQDTSSLINYVLERVGTVARQAS
jgi:hypothetical protein